MGNQESKIKNLGKPWLDSRGNPLAISKLKTESKTWDARTWEAYLSSFEAPLREESRDSAEVARTAESQECWGIPSATEEQVSDAQALLKLLTLKQREVIRMSFFQGLQDVEIARKLKVSPSAISRMKRYALESLKKSRKGCQLFPYLYGDKADSRSTTQGRADGKRGEQSDGGPISETEQVSEMRDGGL